MTHVIARGGAVGSGTRPVLEACGRAREQGADWVAMGVRRTADGVIAVSEDARLADGRLLAESSADDLPPDVPLLISALDACAGLGVIVQIQNLPDDPDFDARNRISEGVAGLILSRDLEEPVWVSSPSIDAVSQIRDLAPDVPTAWVVFDLPAPDQAVARCVAHGVQGIHVHQSHVRAGLVERAHEAGLRVHAWPVDHPDRAAELVRLGVDGIHTNVVDVIREVVDRVRDEA